MAYNPVADEGSSANRRVSLMVYPKLPPHAESIPCTKGDAMACPATEGGKGPCLWYREHVRDAHPLEVIHHHFRLAWLELANGDYLLSALTTVPDEEELEFEVFAATEPVDGEVLRDPSVLLEPLGEPMVCTPTHGVAQVMWTPPASFVPGEDGRIAHERGDRVVPVFRVRHARSGALGLDTWPADEVAILFDRRVTEGAYHAHEATRIELLSDDGGYRSSRAASEATPFDEEHYILRFEGVPSEGKFSLLVYYGEGPGRIVFENVPYAELDDHGAEPSPPPSPEASETPEDPLPLADDDDDLDSPPLELDDDWGLPDFY